MNQLTVAIISFSIIIPVLTGLIRFKKMDRAHYPFILLLTLGFCNEVLSFYLIRNRQSNAWNSNFYILIVGITITYQFKRWQLFDPSKRMYVRILILLILIWIVENLYRSIKTFPSYSIVFYALVIVLMSISMMNKVMANEKGNVFRNPIFIICAGLILFYTNIVIIVSAYIYSLKFSNQMQGTIVRIMSLINLFTNLLYTAAFLWMSRKNRFSFSY